MGDDVEEEKKTFLQWLALQLRPDWTEEKFEQAWVDYLLWKHRKELH